jgi:hypothetical protein
VPDHEVDAVGMEHPNRNVAVFFWVADVSRDLRGQ